MRGAGDGGRRPHRRLPSALSRRGRAGPPELMPTFEGYVGALGASAEIDAAGDLRALDPFSPRPARRRAAR